MVKFQRPNESSIRYIAANMRQADIDEIWATDESTPMVAVTNGWRLSSASAVITINDIPCAIIGVVPHCLLTSSGVVWMLGTDEAMKHRREFLKLSPPVIKEMLNSYSTLFNFVHIDNKASIQWLKWLGFQFEPAKPYGKHGELFHRFYLKSDNHV